MNISSIIAAAAPYVGSLVRKGLVSGGAVLASNGISNPGGDMETIAGAVLAIGGALWSLYNKWQDSKNAVKNA